MSLQFTWDPQKAAANLRKHGVGFPEAATAFADPLSLPIADPDHSVGEERFVLIGQFERRRLVVVAHVERGELIRIMSACPATRPERKTYEEED
jgi:uncharacterized protein